MPEPKHLLFNLKWRLAVIKDAIANLQFLISQIEKEIHSMERQDDKH